MTSILLTKPTIIFMYDFWLYLVYKPYDPLWVLTLYLANLIDLLVNVILRVTYLYILNITSEWWVFLLCPHFMLPSWLIKLSTKLNWQQRNVCGYEEDIHHVLIQCDAHCRLPPEYPLIVNLQSSESTSLWPSGWPFYPLKILGRSDNPWLCSASYKLMHSVFRVLV